MHERISVTGTQYQVHMTARDEVFKSTGSKVKSASDAHENLVN